MKKISVSAPGKLHLLGEHAVVYNKPAIIAAVDKRCFIKITLREDQRIKVTSRNFKTEIIIDFADIVEKFRKAQKDWKTYSENNDIILLKSITKNPLDYPLIIIGQFLNYFKLNSIAGFDLAIDSQIPVGSGMGSSGALAVSMVGALSILFNRPFKKEVINEIAYLSEKIKHGNPSGGDNTTSCFGGFVFFKKDEGVKPLDLSLPTEVANNYYIINTGIPKETTGEMVGIVKILHQKKPKFVEQILIDQEKLVHELLPALETGNTNEIIRIIKMGEQNLEKLGVVSKHSQSIIKEIEKSGGAAKICGGGGIKKNTGIILIYHQNLKSLKKVLKSHRLIPSQLNLGAEGLRKE